MKETIAKRVRSRRRELDLSQTELAKRSHVSRANISLIENGKCNDILVGTLSALAAALETTVEFFLE